MALILGGGQGKRLFPLTQERSKPAVPFGGKYRLVDIPISNALNSGIRRIFVLTQFNSTSLHRHIHRTYPYEAFNQTSVELLAAEQTLANMDWFQGTADAVRKHFTHFRSVPGDTVLVLSGDHLYRMDYQEIIKFHHENKADVTVGTVPVEKNDVRHFGIMQMRSDAQIQTFWEKPSPKENIKSYIMPENIRNAFAVKGKKEKYLASMGIYVFRYEVLRDLLAGKEADFGKEVIPKSIGKYKVFGFVFNDYWRDIGTIGSFFEANIELTKMNAEFDFLETSGRIFTRARFLPPSSFFNAQLNHALIADGCQINGATIEHSVIGLRSVVLPGTVISHSVLMGNDYYIDSRKPNRFKSALGIGKNCRIRNCIIDKNVYIGNRVVIENEEKLKEKDGDGYYIREGIVIIPKGAVISDGTKI